MFATVESFQIIFSIFSLNYIGSLVPLASCECIDKQMKYDQTCKAANTFLLASQQCLEIKIRYDSGGNYPDWNFITAACEVRKSFGQKVVFTFIPGVSEKKDEKGNLICPKQGPGNGDDCMYPILEACVSKIVPDFTKFICCFYALPDDDNADIKCIGEQVQNKEADFKSCMKLQHASIKPVDILMENSKSAHEAFPNPLCPHPLITFNDQTDEKCTRNAFLWDAKKVICAMLAPGVEKACG